MAKDQKLNVEITAEDKASAKITDVAKKVDKLDGKKATAKVDADTSGASSKIDGLTDQLEEFDGPVGNVGANLSKLASPGGAIALIGGGLLLAADHATDMAIEAENLATLTGDSVEEASRLNAVWQQSGADAKDLQDVLLQMNGVLSTNADLASQVGVNLNDGATIGQRFEQVSEALDKIPDAAKRSQLASQLFGEEGVRQYNALRNSVDDLSVALENVPEGKVVSPEDVEQARQMKLQLAELKANSESWASSLGTGLLPILNETLAWNPKRVGTNIGRFFQELALGPNENFDIVEDFDDANEAAAKFDRTLLDGLTTFDQVHAKVLDLTGSEHAANVVAIEWAKSQAVATESTKEHATATELARGQVDAYLDLLGDRGQQVLDDIAAAEERAAKAAQLHAKAIADQQDAVLDSLDGLHDYERSQLATADANEALTDALNNGESTLAGIRDLQLSGSEAALAQAQSFAESAGAADGSTAAALLQRAELERLQGQFPLLAAEIQKYIDKLNSIPATKTTQVILNGAGRAYTTQLTGATGRIVDAVGADGAVVNSPTFAMLGEAGTEAVIPLDKVPGNSPIASLLNAGSLLPANGNSGSGGDTFNITINAPSNNSNELARLVRTEIQKIDRNNGIGRGALGH